MPQAAPISVIMPLHNGAAHIAEAIDSVRRQTLPVAEVIVVDDGSSDESPDIAQSLGAKVIRQENKGAPAARNTGIRAAGQEWVAFLDHDDLWEHDKVEQQWRARSLCPEAGMICCDFLEFADADDRIVTPSVFNLPETGLERLEREHPAEGISYLPEVKAEFFTTVNKNVFFPSALMVRRDLVISIGLFNEALWPVEDIDFFLRLLARSPLAFVERPLMRYRLHENNTSRDELKMLLAFFKFIRYMRDNPSLYPQGAEPAFTAPLAQKYVEAGRLLFDAGDMREARRRLTESLRLRPSGKAAALWLTTLAGPSAFAQMLKMKRSLTRRAAANNAGERVGFMRGRRA